MIARPVRPSEHAEPSPHLFGWWLRWDLEGFQLCIGLHGVCYTTEVPLELLGTPEKAKMAQLLYLTQLQGEQELLARIDVSAN